MVPIRIIMADDHEIFREGFANMCRNRPNIDLVDQVSNGDYLVAAVTQHRPDVVLTDIEMEGMGGIEATQIIGKRFPGTAVIAMSVHEDDYTIMQVLKAGAVGYVTKNASKQVVFDAIEAAFRGSTYYCRTASQKLSALIAAGRFDPKSLEITDFTETELRIIRMICDSLDSKQIAEKLFTGVRNVEKLRALILQKAEVTTVPGLVVFAMRNGIYRG